MVSRVVFESAKQNGVHTMHIACEDPESFFFFFFFFFFWGGGIKIPL